MRFISNCCSSFENFQYCLIKMSNDVVIYLNVKIDKHFIFLHFVIPFILLFLAMVITLRGVQFRESPLLLWGIHNFTAARWKKLTKTIAWKNYAEKKNVESRHITNSQHKSDVIKVARYSQPITKRSIGRSNNILSSSPL